MSARWWRAPLLLFIGGTLVTCGGGGSGETTGTADEATTTGAPAENCQTVSFRSGGRAVPAIRCDPTGASGQQPTPATVVLGGCERNEADRLLTEAIAASLADNGMVGLVVDYLAASSAPAGTFCAPTDEANARLPELLTAITDGAAWLRADPMVDGAPVGAVGYSLGGLLAVYAQAGDTEHASVPAASFGAMALLAAPMYPDSLAPVRAGEMPPLYVIHGEDDDVVPVDDSRELMQAAEAGGTAVTLVLVPSMGHGWGEPENSSAREEAVAEVTEFIATELE